MKPTLAELLRERIVVLDGAMGTMLQQVRLTAADYGGAAHEGCPEALNLTRPDVVQDIHAQYLAAGADVVETNSFGGTRVVLAEFGLQDQVLAINEAAARIARRAAQEAEADGRPRYVAGSMGPTTKTLSVTGGATFPQLREAYREQALGLLRGGVDCLLVETSQDALNVKAAALGIRQAMREAGREVPVLLSATVEPTGTMLAGQAVDAFYAAVEHFRPLTVGLNCATGPEFMTDHLRTLASLATCAVHVYPNAGLPDEDGHYAETPQALARKMARFVDEGLVNLVGGCCGTTPTHIRELAGLVRGRTARVPPAQPRRHVSGIEYLEVSHDAAQRPILVGERTNVIGSRKFKRLVAEGQWEQAAEVGRAQVRNGAQVVDVCLADPDRREKEDMARFLPLLTRQVKAPLMIDSTDPEVIELALQHAQGKSIINSINLEDGEERFERVVPLAKQYGAAVVVGCIDEDKKQGMAVTRARKLAIAERAYELLTGKYGLAPEDIVFDALVFPCGTGDQQYRGSGVETIEGVRLIAERFPECSTILGISNVSFGLPAAGREVLNSVFLHACVQAGLTFAIVNTEGLERYPNLSDEDKRVCEDLLWDRGPDPIAAFAAHFGGRTKRAAAAVARASLTLDERLAACIVEGTKEGLSADLDEALKARKPLDIINGPLMAGMGEVGRLFNANQLIVAEVLQSAEAMKAAVDHLKPHMERVSAATKGRIVLATVKGDVHDIGKNLVEIILGNNGYDVVNLGIKVPPEDLIKAVREHRPDAIGLSGLLVKSAQQMAVTAADLRNADIRLPLLVGGAALTRKFTATRIAPAYGGPTFYAKDAMQGLSIANEWFGGDRAALLQRNAEEAQSAPRPAAEPAEPAAHVPVRWDFPLPRAPDWDRHELRDVDPRLLFPFVNPTMLFGKHLGFRGDVARLAAQGDAKARELLAFVEELKADVAARRLLHCNAVWRWFPAQSRGDTLLLHDPAAPGKVLESFTFPRQAATPQRCISDWVRSVDSGVMDSVAMFTVTAGPGVRELAEQHKQKGEFLRSHAIQALAIETAEGFAEYLHQRIRAAWGIPDAPGTTPRELFKAQYTGLRVSFGYPACPDLADQAKLWRLLHPERIGVQLTEGFMMDPEASVSALVVHHPEAAYFDAR